VAVLGSSSKPQQQRNENCLLLVACCKGTQPFLSSLLRLLQGSGVMFLLWVALIYLLSSQNSCATTLAAVPNLVLLLSLYIAAAVCFPLQAMEPAVLSLTAVSRCTR
jgi:hypothetical protein